MARIQSLLKRYLYLIVIFSILAFGTWFGDGHLTQLEYGVAWVMIPGILLLVRFAKKQRSMDPWIVTYGSLFLVLLALLQLPSDDLAVSAIMWLRFAAAGLVFWIVYCYSTIQDIRVFLHLIFAFALAAIGAAGIIAVLPETFMGRYNFPYTHLLIFRGGHHNMSYLVVLACITCMVLWTYKRTKLYGILTLVFFGITLYTQARAAVLLECISTIFCVLLSSHLLQKSNVYWKIRVSILVVLGAGIMWFLACSPGVDVLFHNTKKTEPIQPRIAYWQQAIHAISTRPLLGSGLGTFFIQSTTYQTRRASYSWSTHNSLLNLLVDIGIVGTIPFLVLLWYIGNGIVGGIRTQRKDKPYSYALCAGLIGVLLYSFVDYPFDFLVISLICIGIVGFLSGTLSQQIKQTRGEGWYVGILSVILFVGGSAIYADKVAAEKEFIPCSYLNYNTNKPCLYNRTTPLPAGYIQRIILLHPRNHYVYFGLGSYEENIGNEQQATIYYQQAITTHPHDLYFTYRYLASIALARKYSQLGSAVTSVGCRRYPSVCSALQELHLEDAIYTPALQQIFATAGQRTVYQDYFLIIYKLGLYFLPSDPQKTQGFWDALARMLPTYAPFHTERASLALHTFHNESAARLIIQACAKYESPRAECTHRLELGLPPPGALAKAIEDMWTFKTQ